MPPASADAAAPPSAPSQPTAAPRYVTSRTAP
jgi:hypothetical protein